jgi:predicted membrane protein
MAVIYPLKHCWWKKTNTTFIICFIWILSLLTASPLLYYTRAVPFNYSGLALYDCREEWEGQLNSRIYTITIFIITFIIPFTALTFLYGSIGIKTFKKKPPGETLFSKESVRYRRKIKVLYHKYL